MADEKGGGKMLDKGMGDKGGPGKPMPNKDTRGGKEFGKGGGKDMGGGKK
jgi:hypothetical protein